MELYLFLTEQAVEQTAELPATLDALTFMWRHLYLEPVYTDCSSVHWKATGMPLVDPVIYTWIPLGDPANIAGQGALEHHWKNLVETALHWNATGETPAIAAYTGTLLEGL